ncbi:hypothetical protein [Rhodopila globiformis]|uniref:HEAT repeat domain-containing protein n=1 Tax=Rhodopila globiformis TaxID=1071 RepID=A0A2S6N6U3_RHOGL|nr:hypothetical protein [Rhodopila globiformis]PPQ30342.1 hypothetical protein CCS01_19490 [Rhodopila globiformis]
MQPDRQPDLFAGGGGPAPVIAPQPASVASALDDAALIAVIPDATQRSCQDLAGEAAARRLAAAVPALEALCRRFKGFGLAHPVPEQMAAVRALGAIGGREAAQALARIVTDQVVQGPGADTVLREAARLRQRLPDALVLGRIARTRPELAEDALDALRDIDSPPAAALAEAIARETA